MADTSGKLSLRQKARLLKSDILALFFALKHPATPWYAKALVALIVGYALSPVDFVPDFIPVLGYLDDVILLPLGIALAVRFIPPAVLADCRHQAAAYGSILPKLWLGTAVIILLWLAVAYAAYRLLA